MKRRFTSFARAEAGIAYLEFAIALPFLIAIFLGAVEMTRYIIIVQKVEKATVTVTDVVAQSSTIGTTQLNQIVQAAAQIVQPYTFNTNGYVIITSVSRTGSSPPVIRWRYTSSGSSGSWTQASQVGNSVGATATLPAGITLDDKENVIIAEIYYNFQPMLVHSVIAATEIYKVSVFKPRLGELTTLGS